MNKVNTENCHTERGGRGPRQCSTCSTCSTCNHHHHHHHHHHHPAPCPPPHQTVMSQSTSPPLPSSPLPSPTPPPPPPPSRPLPSRHQTVMSQSPPPPPSSSPSSSPLSSPSPPLPSSPEDTDDVLAVSDDVFDIQMALCMLNNVSTSGDTTASAVDIVHCLLTHPTDDVCRTCKIMLRVKSRLEAGLRNRRFVQMPKRTRERHRQWGVTAAFVLQEPTLRRGCGLVETVDSPGGDDERTTCTSGMPPKDDGTSLAIAVAGSTPLAEKRKEKGCSFASLNASVVDHTSDREESRVDASYFVDQRGSGCSCSICEARCEDLTGKRGTIDQEHEIKTKHGWRKATIAELRAHDSAFETTGCFEVSSDSDSDESSKVRLKRSTSQSSVGSHSSSSSAVSWGLVPQSISVRRSSSLLSIGSQFSSEVDSALSTTDDDSISETSDSEQDSLDYSDSEELYAVDERQADVLGAIRWTTFEDLLKVLHVDAHEHVPTTDFDSLETIPHETDSSDKVFSEPGAHNLPPREDGEYIPEADFDKCVLPDCESWESVQQTTVSETTDIIKQAFLIAMASSTDDLEIPDMESTTSESLSWNYSPQVSAPPALDADSDPSCQNDSTGNDCGEVIYLENTPEVLFDADKYLDRPILRAESFVACASSCPATVYSDEDHTDPDLLIEKENSRPTATVDLSMQSCPGCSDYPDQDNHDNVNAEHADESCDDSISRQLQEEFSAVSDIPGHTSSGQGDESHVQCEHSQSCSSSSYPPEERGLFHEIHAGDTLLLEESSLSFSGSLSYIKTNDDSSGSCFPDLVYREKPDFEAGALTFSRSSFDDSSMTGLHVTPGYEPCQWPFSHSFVSPVTQAVIDESAEASRWLEEHSVDSSTYSPAILGERPGPSTLTFGRYFANLSTRSHIADSKGDLRKPVSYTASRFLYEEDSPQGDADLAASDAPSSLLMPSVDEMFASPLVTGPLDNEISFGFTERL